MRWLVLVLAVLLAPAPRALAQPETVASIAPVHSLVARVMQGAGTPYLLVPPGASPHDFALRPSGAGALEEAELIFRVGEGIDLWLDGPLVTLAEGTRVVRLDEVEGLTRLALREGEAFGPHDHGAQDHGKSAGQGQEDAGAHGHNTDDGHAHGEHAHGEHAHGEFDPHLWLDPANAKLWLGAIADALVAADPANAPLYRANAEAGRTEIDVAQAEIEALLAPLRDRPFIVYHDAFHYFEHRFRIEAAGALSASDARAPGPARIAAIRELIRETGARCVFREPQFRSALAETVVEGTHARIGVLDPTGATFEPGPGLYTALLRGIAEGLADCLG